MKTIYSILTIMVFAAATSVMSAQDYPEEYLGLPGDNLNLYAVMNLFQQSETLEKFEQDLNSEELMINNLDLNGDNLIDYITVSDYVDGNVHNIVLRAALSRNEQQDVAVFVVEQLSNGAVQIQLIGDEALYGPNYIVEPIYASTPNPGYTGTVYRNNVNVVTTTYYDIAAWPLIRFIFRPGYIMWRSSWYWGYYPTYWHPWRTHYWHYYYGYHYHWHNHYYTHYRHWNHYRCRNYTTYYKSKVRVYSPTVAVNINKGRYRNTYSRPEQRRAGEEYYARSASTRGSATRSTTNAVRSTSTSRSNAVRSGNSRSSQPSNRSSVRPTSQRSQATRSSAVQRSQPTRSSAVQRSQATRSSAAQRSQSSNNRGATVQRSSNAKATPSVQRSSSSSNRSSVQRSQPTRSSAVQRSQSSRSSSVKRSQPSQNRSAVQRSNSSKKSAPSVQRSSSSRSSSAVKRSQPSNNRSSVKRSQPSNNRSSVKRSQPSRSSSSVKSSSSSSRKSASNRSSSSSSRRK